MKHDMANDRTELHKQKLPDRQSSEKLSPDEQWLNDALNSVPDATMPSHLAARLADLPRTHPRRSVLDKSVLDKSWWPFGSWLPVVGWGIAAAAGILLGVSGPEELLSPDDPQNSEIVEFIDVGEQEESDEWQELAQLALDSNWQWED